MSVAFSSLQPALERERTPGIATPSAAGRDRVLGLRSALGNQALQRLVQSRLRLGAEQDAEERDADRPADGSYTRSSATVSDARPLGPVLGAGTPLAAELRQEMEPRLGADLGAVRVHADTSGEGLAGSLGARALAAGADIAFAAGEYAPSTDAGQQLIAHELAHVLQPSAAHVLRRQPVTTPPAAAPSVTDKDTFEHLVLNVAKARLYNNRYNLEQWRLLVQSQFTATELKAQVQAVEAQRLEQIARSQGGLALSTYASWTGTENPIQRFLQEEQIQGRFRACTGCHLQVYAWNWGLEHPRTGPEWQSPAQQLTAAAASLQPAPPTTAGRSLASWTRPGDEALLRAWITGQPSAAAPFTQPAAKTPQTQPPLATPTGAGTEPAAAGPGVGQQEAVTQGQVRAAIELIKPIVQQLGPDGYQVLPVSSLSLKSGMTAADVRDYVLGHIDLRRVQYAELIRRIDAGDVDYLKFAQVVDDLLSLASEEVRSSVASDRLKHSIKEVVRDILIIGATIALLLLSVFPPTTAVGLAGLTALEATTGGLLLWRGVEHVEEGSLYALGKGGDVFRPEQTAAAEMLQVFGTLDIAFGVFTLGAAAAHAQQLAGLPRAPEAGFPQLAAGPRTVQRGPVTAVIEPNGTVTITHAGFPDQLMIVRGGNATLYQSMGPGGLRVLGEFNAPTPTAPSGPPLLGPGVGAPAGGAIVPWSGPGPLVPWRPAGGPLVPFGPTTPFAAGVPLQLSPGTFAPIVRPTGQPYGVPDIFAQAPGLAPEGALGAEALTHLTAQGEPTLYVVDPISGDLLPWYFNPKNPYETFNPALTEAQQWAALRKSESGQLLPAQLEPLLQGQLFDRAAGWAYPVNQLPIQASGGRPVLDSYDPVSGEIISRKHVQLARDHWDSLDALQEFTVKYPSGATIADTPRTRVLGLAGQRIRGRMVLEVSVQTEPVPADILTEARNRGITIRDTAGRTY